MEQVKGEDIVVTRSVGSALPDWSAVLAVVAHPDDESFGLGAVIDAFVEAGTRVDVLCFTHGEASELGADQADLAQVRAGELRAAADVLGIGDVRLRDHPDGGLQRVRLAPLSTDVASHLAASGAEGLLVFDTTGITGHPDHQRATAAAIDAGRRRGVGVLAWTVPSTVAERLRVETGAPFVGRADQDIDLVVRVRRDRQRAAAHCHPSQAVPGSALWRRLDLLGEREHLRWCVPVGGGA